MRLLVLLLLGILFNSNAVRSQECEENSVFPHATSNRLYSKCINGKPTLKLCSIGYVFDEGLKSCVLKVTNDNLHGCREGDKEASAACVSYKVCQNGQWVDKYCPLYFKFNPIKKECVYFTEYKCPILPNNGCENGRTEPVDSRQYRSCVEGKWVLKSCGLGETFDGDAMSCAEEKASRRARRDAPECEEGHRRRVEGSCRDYVECEGGRYVNKTCADCMNFDDKSSKCKIFFVSACPSPAPPVPTDPTPEPEPTPSPEPEPSSSEPSPGPTPTPKPNTMDPSNRPSSEFSTQPQPTPSSQPILCNNGEKIPIPGDCSSYQECVNGEYQKNKCSLFRKFDSIEKKCMFWGAKCA